MRYVRVSSVLPVTGSDCLVCKMQDYRTSALPSALQEMLDTYKE